MGRGINKVILVGNLGEDPISTLMVGGRTVTNITVATSESWKDKTTGQPQERTEWHKVCFFNKLAEIAEQYLKKGSKVYIEGSLRTKKWDDREGVKHYKTEIVASEMQMLDSKPKVEESGKEPHQGQYYGGNQQDAQQSRQPAPPIGGTRESPGIDAFEDDIPF